jgi:gluconate 5-dehydrogenase
VSDVRDLGGIRVLITGAPSGLGAAMAAALVEAGARVMVTSRDQARADFLMARAVVPMMLREAGGGRVVNISMNEQRMVRRGFGPAGAGVEALSRVMAADLVGGSVTVNILLPGGRGPGRGWSPMRCLPRSGPDCWTQP